MKKHYKNVLFIQVGIIIFLLLGIIISNRSASDHKADSQAVRQPPPTVTPGLAQASELLRDVGVASYYADKFHGRPTASGEAYNKHDFTAAHRTYSYGTRVRVTNLDNGKSVIVRINDRGPAKKKRIIDLSSRAAEEIGLIQAGVAKVSLEVLR